MSDAGTETVILLSDGPWAGERDRYGHKILGPDVETPLDGAVFAPTGSTEPLAVGRSQVITNDTLYFRRAVPVTAQSRIRVRGVVRNVDGDPDVFQRASRTVGTVVRLTHTEG